MEHKKLREIAEDTAGEFDLMKFDDHGKHSINEPGLEFTERVMAALPSRNTKVGLHIWGILIGVALVLIMWGMEGFVTPAIELEMNIKYFDTGSIELTDITKVFMMFNALLLLLVIDRIIQRKRTA